MMPLLGLYNYVNYSRWEAIYLAYVHQLPNITPKVYEDFASGKQCFCFEILPVLKDL
jgi:hypothetical protein